MTAATTSPRASHADFKTPGFGATLASEWTKLFSLRSTYITIVLGILLSIGMTALITLAVGSTFDDWTPADQATFEPVMFSLVGILVGSIVFSVLGVNVTATEYSSKMMGLTLTATPKRGRVLMAKLLIVTLVTLIAGFITVFGMFFVGQAVLGSYDMPTASLGDSETFNAILGISLGTPLFPVFGAALGVLLRSTAGAITSVLALLWAPEMFGGLLPSWWQQNILSLMPGTALDSLTIREFVEGERYIDNQMVAAVVVLAWIVILVGGALLALKRRDA